MQEKFPQPPPPLLRRLKPTSGEGAPSPFRSGLLDYLKDQSVRPIHEQKTRLFAEARVANFLKPYEGRTPGLLATAQFIKDNDDITWKQYYEIRAQLRGESQSHPASVVKEMPEAVAV